MLTNLELTQIIGKELEAIWIDEIKTDYECGWLLKEDTLKNALYFHLRNRLGKVLDENDLRIFTEFTDGKFKHRGCRPDMVIAKVNTESDEQYWGDSVTECLAVIELKYKAGYASCEEIYADYDKLQYYVETLGISGQLYMATIWEQEDEKTSWTEDAEWMRGRLTELNASYKSKDSFEPQFYIIKH